MSNTRQDRRERRGRGNGRYRGNDGDYDRGYDQNYDRDYNDRPPREPREWKEEETFRKGDVRARITSSVFNGKKVHTFSFSRMFKERLSNFYRKENIEDLEYVLDEVRLWFQADEADEGERNESVGNR